MKVFYLCVSRDFSAAKRAENALAWKSPSMEYISKWCPNKETVLLFSLSAELRQALMQLTKTILACLPIITAGEVVIW